MMSNSSELLLSFFSLPRYRLSPPLWLTRRPSAMLVFVILFASYFLVLSGIVYDVIMEPPSIGMTRDEETGASKPVVFVQYRINGQYIIEGLSAGLLFVMGGLGVILLERCASTESVSWGHLVPSFPGSTMSPRRNRYLLALCASAFIIIAYVLSRVFMRIKLPGY